MLRDINRKLGDPREGIFQLHHKDTDAFEKTFRLETSAVIEPLFKSTSNSFLKTESSLICITAKHVLNNKASNSVKISEKIRREPYNNFVENILHNASPSVYGNIRKNNLPLFV